MGKKDLLKAVLSEAKTYAPRAKTCVTCDMPAEFHEVVEEVSRLVSKGESKASMSWLHRQLRDNFEYPYQNTTLRRHLEVCRPDLFKAWRR